LNGFIRRWIITFLAVVVVAVFLPGLVSYTDLAGLAIFAVVLALLNAFVRPILLLLTLPINLITLGLFVLVINGFMFWLASRIYSGVSVAGFWEAFLAALVVSVIGFLANRIIR